MLSGTDSSMRCGRDGHPIRLTALEFRILHLLSANHGRVVPYDRLIEHGWGHEGGSPHHLKVRVAHLRKKLGLPVNAEVGIQAVTGAGYTLCGLEKRQRPG